MKRNKIYQDVYFTKNDIVRVPRNVFYRNNDHKTTFSAGKLVPIHVDEILPGDTYEFKMNSVIRFSNPMIRPVMDDVKFEAWAFFVPSRLLDDNFEKIIANYKINPDWTTDVATTLSSLQIPSTGFGMHSVADYFGLPVNKGDNVVYPTELVSLLPFRGYTRIWDDYFRDENLQPAITIEHAGYQALTGVTSASGDYATDAVKGGALCPLNKVHDYFTSALPAPQKGAAPLIGLAGTAPITLTSDLPIISKGTSHWWSDGTTAGKSSLPAFDRPTLTQGYSSTPGTYYPGDSADIGGVGTGDRGIYTFNGQIGSMTTGTPGSSKTIYGNNWYAAGSFANGIADLSQATGISINDLRLAVQIQRLKEQDARYGSRYTEYLLGSWGVISGDARLQRPEFLGKVSFNLSVNQVVQNSETSATSAQGNLSAYSLTGNVKHMFSKSFVEHGYIFVLGGVRIPNRTYSQNINKMWSKFTRLDFYNPVFANLGEQPIKNKELMFTKDNTYNNGVFGYQEAWAEYRYLPNKATGYMRPGITDSLAVWNYAESYTDAVGSRPTLSGAFIKEDIAPVDRSLAIPSSVGANFIADFFFENKATRPIPLHSIPGLMDHSGKIIL